MMITYERPPVPLGDHKGQLFVAVPTAADLIEMESRKEKPDVVLWYLVRFLVDEEGRPFLRTEEDARKVAANIATSVVMKVQEQLAARP